MTVELMALRDIVLSPQLDPAGAVERWGEVLESSADVATLRASPPFAAVVLELFHGQLAGVQFTWQADLRVRWSEVLERLGPGQLRTKAWDDWGGPTPYRFKSSTKDFPRAYVLLSVSSLEGDQACIRGMIVRRRLVELAR